jgi:hypothetical protein
MSFNNLLRKTAQTLQRVRKDITAGNPVYISGPGLVESGVSLYLEDNILKSSSPKFRNLTSLSPEAVILVKKKAFSSFANANDLRYLEKTERMLLRATKALFAYKIQQIRAYESLTKFENFYKKTGTYSLNLLSSMLRQSSFIATNQESFSSIFLNKLNYKNADEYANAKLKEWMKQPVDMSEDARSLISSDKKVGTDGFLKKTNHEYKTNQEFLSSLPSLEAKNILNLKLEFFKSEYNSSVTSDILDSNKYFGTVSELYDYATNNDAEIAEIIDLIRRNAFSQDTNLTTWIVDPNSVDNYLTGPGTGVIELTTFVDLSCDSSNSSNPSSGSFTMEFPYGIGRITDDDIEIAIEEAIRGTLGLFSDLASNGFMTSANGISKPTTDGITLIGAGTLLSGSDSIDQTIDVNYIRKSLRTFYLGKPIINPSDVVHFYIRGNKFKQSHKGIEDDILTDEAEYSISESVFKAEYQLYTNKQINYDTYKNLRKEQDNSLGMVHVFCGYVETSSESYNGGYTQVRVSAKDNMGWLSWSSMPREPALSDVTSILEDPLTPYKLSVDDTYSLDYENIELLEENKKLLSSNLLSYSSGLYSGSNANSTNIYQGQYSGIGSLDGKKIVQHADGFVYRWKTGIVSATAGFNTIGGKSTVELSQYTQYYAPTATKNPINNLDVANIISTLVTGEPYNILRFIEQSFEAGNKSSRSVATLGPSDPLQGYLDSIRKQNKIYGNFKPYRLFTQNSATLEILSLQGKKQTINNEVKILSNKKAKLNEQIIKLQNYVQNSPIIWTLRSEVSSIDESLKRKLGDALEVNNAINSSEKLSSSLGSGFLFDSNDSSPLFLGATKDEHEEIVRAMSKVGALRRIEDVRLNRDNNYLIISDQYDTSDIRPFILGMNSSQYKKFDGEYENMHELCTSASNHIHMEFFCNTQGHIELRPPQWNKIPLTLLRDLVRYKKITGKDIIPDFITSSLKTREKVLYENVYYSNVRIVLIALLLGRFPDSSLIPGVKYAAKREFQADRAEHVSDSSMSFFGVTFTSGTTPQARLRTNFKSTEWDAETNNSISNQRDISNNLENGIFLKATITDDVKFMDGDTSTLLGDFDAITIASQTLIEDLENQLVGYGNPIAKSVATTTNLNKIRSEFKKITGRDPGAGLSVKSNFEDKDLLFVEAISSQNQSFDDKYTESTGKINKLIRELNVTISSRDSYVRLLKSSLERKKELESAIGILTNSDESLNIDGAGKTTIGADGTRIGENQSILSGAQEILERTSDVLQTAMDVITGDTYKSTPFDYLIEDDTVNNLGYGSGKRFIIYDDQIISYSLGENPPSFTRVDVVGDTPLNLTGELASQTDGKLLWAGATDFDMWRQYGYKVSQPINVPFITDAETMGKPFAILELLIASADVNSGTVSVIGNEFYQPGDTVYLASKNLLYYVTNVSHNFSYSSNEFSTSLTLKYGRPPGSYLPNPMDIFGQQTLGATDTPILTYRSSKSDDNYIPLSPECSLIIPRNVAIGEASSPEIELLSNGDNNLRFTQMMAQLSTGYLSGERYLLIRAFVKESGDTEGLAQANRAISAVRSIFQNPIQVYAKQEDSFYADLKGSFNSIGNTLDITESSDRYKAQRMALPNSRIAYPIPSDKIIEQISYIKKESTDSSTIRCLDRKLIGMLKSSKDENLDSKITISDLFPKDGPRQKSWLDIRDNIDSWFTEYFNIIEIGIITLPAKVVNNE